MLTKKYLIITLIISISVLTGCKLSEPVINNTQTPTITQNTDNTNTPIITPTIPVESTPTITPSSTPYHTLVPSVGKVDVSFANSLDTNGVFWTNDSSSKLLLKKYGGFSEKDTGNKRIYLTYNLGTEFGLTNELLDVLKEKNVKASFFPIGSYVKSNIPIIERLVREGHLLGSHGESHDNQTKVNNWPTEKLIQDFDKLQKRYQDIFGEDFRIHYYRPPYGFYNERNLYIAKTLGYTSVFWSFTYSDWDPNKPIGADKVYDLYMDKLHDGMILQLHVTTRDSVDVLNKFVDNARKLGYEFYRVDDMK